MTIQTTPGCPARLPWIMAHVIPEGHLACKLCGGQNVTDRKLYEKPR